MKKNIILLLLALLCGKAAMGQIPQMPQSLPSPTVAGLGLYGEIPVSPFTGTPDISIPLYEAEVGDFRLPVSLSYHASGVRPDQHPGWTGLGWNLNIGGVISRIVKGQPDDLNTPDQLSSETGYYFHPEALASNSWNQLSYLTDYAGRWSNLDFEPDEFIFNFFDYQGKFMLNHEGRWVVQCDRPLQVEFSGNFLNVPFDKSGTYFANMGYSAVFEGFTITTEDGTRYQFGVHPDAIEYSIDFFKQATEPWIATAWHLSRIILPNGKEIVYKYTRKDFINQMFHNLHQYESYTKESGSGLLKIECGNREYSSFLASIQGMLISPVYLERVTMPGGEMLVLESAVTNELRYTKEIYDFQEDLWSENPKYRFLRFLAKDLLDDDYPACLNKLKWHSLNRLLVKDRLGSTLKTYNFTYNNVSTERLMLLSVSESGTELQGKKYSMEYELSEFDPLPGYLSGKVDHWGFFNNRQMSESFATHYESREPNAAVLTRGVLRKLYYPTGGYTRFVFEPHQYRKQPKVNRWEGCENLSANKIAGGLRIKQIIHNLTLDPANEVMEKEYFYTIDYLLNKENSSTSSGILGGQIRYDFPYYEVHGIGANQHIRRSIKWCSSQSVLPACINSAGCHIGYSEVVEKRADNSFIRYQYSNFDNGYLDESPDAVIYEVQTPYMPYASKSMERGKLLLEEMYDADGTLKRSRSMTYEPSSSEYVRSMKAACNQLCSNAFPTYLEGCCYKTHMYICRMTGMEEKLYDNPDYPIVINNEYGYNPYGLLMTESTSVNGGTLSKTYLRPSDLAPKFVLLEMFANHVLSPVIQASESYKDKNGNIQNLRTTHYDYQTFRKPNKAMFFCVSIREQIGDSPLREIASCTKFDSWGHPLAIQKDGAETVRLWGYNEMLPIAEIHGSTYEEVEEAIGKEQLTQLTTAVEPDKTLLNLLRTSLPEAQVTTCTHKPLVGMTSITDPRNVSTYYEYDNLLRLKCRKDTDGNIEQLYDYKFINPMKQ